uniref:Uncharacterized protein n=1 Tax=Romanomermis culicivorax TaxID=13658 RepID=A0A915KFQ1_ROMCU
MNKERRKLLAYGLSVNHSSLCYWNLQCQNLTSRLENNCWIKFVWGSQNSKLA